MEEAWRRAPDRRLAQAAAELSERLGELEAAVDWWHHALGEKPTPEQAVRLATLQILLGRDDAARRSLEAARNQETAPASYWRLRAALASRAGDRTAARFALERLLAQADAEPVDLNDLEWLLAEEEPLAAARVAVLRWQRFHDQAALIRALERYQASARFEEAQTLLGGLDPATRERLEQDPRYCLLAARQAWQMRQIVEARRLYTQAERLAPQNVEVAEALLWFAIENADTAAVRRLLARHETQLAGLERNDVRIAAHALLNEAGVAWRLAAAELPRRREDPLWLITAADLLEQLDRHDEAWQLRRHALRQIERVAPEARLIARARLAASLTPGDQARAALTAAVLDDPERASPLLLAHWINAGEFSLARAWLYGRLAQATLRPRWAELAVALADDDRESLARLLAQPEDLPRRDAVEGARRLFEPEAASLAFAAQSRLGTDDELQGQLDELLRAGGHHASLTGEALRFPAFDETQTRLGAQGTFLPHLKLALELTSIQRSLKDTTALGKVVNERRALLTAVAKRGEDDWELSLGRREAFAQRTPLSFAYRRRRGHWEAVLEAGHAQPAEESTALRVAGEKDSLALRLSIEPVRPFAFSARAAAQRYRAQTGSLLGQGREWEVHATTWLRREDPDWLLDLFASRHQYRPRAVGDAALAPLLPPASTAFDANFFLPRDFTLWGLTLSSRLALLDSGTRALRPFWSLSLTRHSEDGFGYDALLGVAASPLGADHLALGGQWARAQGTTPGTTRRLLLRYRLDF
ncbi:tetratricopeptide repeat protein [Thiobacter aerophilum]|uniref:Tetratricopeptide repeat protein n=1 Tax=Thiobacter aerophilum TaxID=3121275 RepID=A0ABV0EG77_9BURK